MPHRRHDVGEGANGPVRWEAKLLDLVTKEAIHEWSYPQLVMLQLDINFAVL